MFLNMPIIQNNILITYKKIRNFMKFSDFQNKTVDETDVLLIYIYCIIMIHIMYLLHVERI